MREIDRLTKEEVENLLISKKIMGVSFSPYMRITLDDGSNIEIVPEQIRIDDYNYLDLSFKQTGSNIQSISYNSIKM